MGDSQRETDRLCETSSWRLLCCEACCLGLVTHSCTTSSDGAAASIFNSQWDIPEGGGGGVGARRSITPPRRGSH